MSSFAKALAATLALSTLAGCVTTPTGPKASNSSTTTTKPSTSTTAPANNQTTATAPAKPQAAAATSEQTADAAAEEQQADDFATMMEQEDAPARYVVADLASDLAKVQADAAQARLDAAKAAADAAAAAKVGAIATNAGTDAAASGAAVGTGTAITGAVVARDGAATGVIGAQAGVIGAQAGASAALAGALAAKGDIAGALAAAAQARATAGDARAEAAKARAEAAVVRADAAKARAEALKAVAAMAVELRTKLLAQRTAVLALIATRLARYAGERAKLHAAVLAAAPSVNADGTKTRVVTFDTTVKLEGKDVKRTCKIERTTGADGVLVSSEVTFDATLPSGGTRHAVRTKTLQADGSYSVTFGSDAVFAGGVKRTASWTRKIALDGTVSGSGSIIFADKDGADRKAVAISLGGKEEAVAVKAVDADANAVAEIRVGADGSVKAETTGSDGKTASVDVQTDASGTVAISAASVDAAIAVTK